MRMFTKRNLFPIPSPPALITGLLLIALLYFLATRSTSTNNPATDFRPLSKLPQDNPELISLIKRNYLIPPPPSPNHLNLASNKLWNSPQIARVIDILDYKTNGIFLEAGALDGEYLSNTLELEVNYNWTGLLVEADPEYQKELIGKNRNAWITPACLSPENYTTNITFDKSPKSMRGMSNIGELQYPPRTDYNVHFHATCFPLYSLVLAALNHTRIDYLSLDIEGSEWPVLQTIPFDKFKVKVISMEMQRVTRMHQDDIHELLGSYGFKFQEDVIVPPHVHDQIFVHRNGK